MSNLASLYCASIQITPDGHLSFTRRPKGAQPSPRSKERLKGRSGRSERPPVSYRFPRTVPSANAPLAKNKISSTAEKTGYGRLPARVPRFGAHQRRQIRRHAAALERVYGNEQLVFATIVCPGSTHAAKLAFSSYSSWALQNLRRRLTRWLLAHGCPEHLLGTSEFQKRGMLHWHIINVVPGEELKMDFIMFFQAAVYEMFVDMGLLAGVDMFQKRAGFTHINRWEKIKDYACNVQRVKKSLGGYLGKYMSKGSYSEPGQKTHRFMKYPPPAQWWFCSDSLRATTKNLTVRLFLPELSAQQLDECVHELAMVGEVFSRWSAPITNPYSNEDVGWQLSGDYELLIDLGTYIAESYGVGVRTASEFLTRSVDSLRNKWSRIWAGTRVLKEVMQEEAKDLLLEWLNTPYYQRVARAGPLMN